MRKICLILLMSVFYFTLLAQVTIIKSFPNDTFDLACEQCSIKITAKALTKGQQSIPNNLDKPVKINLLHWKYYDDIVKEEVLTEDRPIWTEGTQLITTVDPAEMLSLHINLTMTDSAGREYRIFLVMAGINRQELEKLPLETSFDLDTYSVLRFSALLQSVDPKTNIKETYDCIDGNGTMEILDLKTGKMQGYFNFTGSRIGLDKKVLFINGRIKT